LKGLQIQWFLPGLMSFLWLTCPAIAGELASWQFDPTQNRLEFTTNEGVQPRAQLVPNPTRLVIDLPGTTMGGVQRSQELSGSIRQVRLGQFDATTTRIVVELAPGYVLDPQQVQFRGLTPTEWIVQLPTPDYVGVAAPLPVLGTSSDDRVLSHAAAPSPPVPPPPTSSIQSPPPMVQGSALPSPAIVTPPDRVSSVVSTPTPDWPDVTSPPPPGGNNSMAQDAVTQDGVTQIESLQITNDGLFLRTRGAPPTIDDIDRSRNRRSITITVENAVIAPQLSEQEQAIEQFGIEQLQFEQINEDNNDLPSVKITLRIDRDSPNWNASASGIGGIVLLPQQRSARQTARRSSATQDTTQDTNMASSQNVSRRSQRRSEPDLTEAPDALDPSTASAEEPDLSVATIEGIEFDPSNRQLLIRSDRPMTHAGQWRSGMYQVRLFPARLANQVTGPQLATDSPLLRVRLREEEDETVVVMIQPAAGVRFGALNWVTPQLLALEMERSSPTAATPPASNRTSYPVSQNNASAPSLSMPPSSGRIPNGRLVIVIDPGHGGADVGAVGVGNIHEADVVLPIAQQVGALLQQQGVHVVMTRNDDREIDLEPRVQMAEQANATLFVSIHANSMGMDRPDVNGTETYYYSSGAGLAQVIQTNIVNTVGTNDRGIRQARFYVLRRTTMPAVLVEIGYVTGREDGPRLADANFQAQMARAIAQGILQYVQSMASQ
jgi:N-acetylmuramoyl-L-alanine amidase